MSAQTIDLFAPAQLDATTVASGYVPGTPLTKYQAQVLTDGIITTLEAAQDMLRVAFRGKAHEALGYGKGQAGWDAYFADKFADIVIALPVATRQLEVAKWNDAGASLAATATALGVSKATISDDRKVVGQPQNVVSLDGKRRDAVAASATAVEVRAAAPKKRAVPLTVRIEAMVRDAGATGMTSKEALAKLRGLHHGEVSSVFTALKQQRRTHLTGERRDGYGIHVTGDFLVVDAEIVDAEVED